MKTKQFTGVDDVGKQQTYCPDAGNVFGVRDTKFTANPPRSGDLISTIILTYRLKCSIL